MGSVINILNQLLEKNESAWNKLANVLLGAEGVDQCFGYLALEDNGKMSYCALGYAAKKVGHSDKILGFGMLFPFRPRILEKYGFDKEDRSKKRLCTEDGCKYTGRLDCMMTHLNDHHRIRIPEIGRRIRKIRDDKRKLPSFWKRLIYSFEDYGCY